MLKAVIPPWLLAVLAVIWSVSAGLVESGVLPEGSPAYTVAVILSAALAGVVGVKGVIKERAARRDQPLHFDHRKSSLRTKPPRIDL